MLKCEIKVGDHHWVEHDIELALSTFKGHDMCPRERIEELAKGLPHEWVLTSGRRSVTTSRTSVIG